MCKMIAINFIMIFSNRTSTRMKKLDPILISNSVIDRLTWGFQLNLILMIVQ